MSSSDPSTSSVVGSLYERISYLENRVHTLSFYLHEMSSYLSSNYGFVERAKRAERNCEMTPEQSIRDKSFLDRLFSSEYRFSSMIPAKESPASNGAEELGSMEYNFVSEYSGSVGLHPSLKSKPANSDKAQVRSVGPFSGYGGILSGSDPMQQNIQFPAPADLNRVFSIGPGPIIEYGNTPAQQIRLPHRSTLGSDYFSNGRTYLPGTYSYNNQTIGDQQFPPRFEANLNSPKPNTAPYITSSFATGVPVQARSYRGTDRRIGKFL